MISNYSGDTVAGYYQEGFGNVKQTVGSADNYHHLTTKELDPDTGLYYFSARWYDPEVGRFLNRDPKFSVNLYNYVKNNPLIKIDPSGRSQVTTGGLACAGALVCWWASAKGCEDGCGWLWTPGYVECVIDCEKGIWGSWKADRNWVCLTSTVACGWCIAAWEANQLPSCSK